MLRHLLTAIAIGLTVSPTLAAPLFRVPSSAMMPTLGEGDVFLAIPPTRPLQRGDLVVYFADHSHQTSRVVALGKEVIEVKSGQIFIDGIAMGLTPLGQPIHDACPPLVTEGKECRFLRETTPEGTSYVVIDSVTNAFFDDIQPVYVPKGHVFVMSDNRDNSVDSRYTGRGPISAGGIIGLIDTIVTTPRLIPDRNERLAGFPNAN